jgi:SAM-dependent methyltransferase
MHDSSPSSWVRRFAGLIVTGGRVLDVACGAGRHARLLAQMGYRVEAVDRDPLALEQLTAEPAIDTRVADLESDTWPYPAGSFDGVIVTNYLHRPLFAALVQTLRPSGVLIYETFMVGNERFGKPSSSDFLLQPNELFDRVNDRLSVVAFEQGVIEAPKPACVQRICAVAAAAGRIP